MKNTKKIVLTGGPCAGKTTMIEVIGRVFSDKAATVPEAASLLFTGGFPRWREPKAEDATQRAIYAVQCELEASYEAHFADKVIILDRGTIDGAVYWSTGPQDFFKGIGSSLEKELARYDVVIYLESAGEVDYIRNAHKNPNRIEPWATATLLDKQTRELWSQHPKMITVHNGHSFDLKIKQVLEIISKHVRQSGP